MVQRFSEAFRGYGVIGLAGILLLTPAAATATELGIRDAHFTIDGKETFLFGISYYGALGTPPKTIEKDLSEMQRLGINWIRVWATWGAFDNDVTAVDRAGKPRDPFFSRLKRLVKECDRRGMIVDVTLSRGNGAVGPPRLQSLEVHRQAVVTIVSGLRSYRNWYVDLANERNIQDKRHVPLKEVRVLRDAVKKVDPHRLVTASRAGDIPRKELKQYLMEARVDFIAPHRPRNARSARQTKAKTREYFAWMKEIGKTVPVHYQEPFRRGFTRGWEPTARDYVVDALEARKGGAAGWCLHNGGQRSTPDGRPRRSFDMRRKGLFEQLDTVEKSALEKLHRALAKERK